MHNILHSVYLKHDTSFKSLTKQALAQIVLKIIYKNGEKGVPTQKIRNQLKDLTGVSFDTNDINESLARLENVENKIHSKSGKHFIRNEYRNTIIKAVEESEKLHSETMKYWFGKSETYSLEGGIIKLNLWFESLLIRFFKDYSYDWIKDLRPNKSNGKKKTPNLENIISSSLLQNEILSEDKDWLKNRFISFIESDRKEDNDLLWAYGSCMFSATLLTARNYADEFSLEIFRNSNFILDTNILMILELEGYEKNYALSSIENIFEKLSIQPKYFHISKEEYKRAIGPRRANTLAAVREFDFDVIKEIDCSFVQTALRRGCVGVEDFERFFDKITDIPSVFYESLELKCEDYSELIEAIEVGQKDEKIKNGINEIYKRRTTLDKRERPKEHDAGLYKGVEFLNKTKKSMLLTRDSILREYAFESSLRDSQPIAIGLDSLIQMMAINSGGAEFDSTNFAPLFGRLVKEAIIPEKDAFKPADLDFILKTRVQISELAPEQVIKIAKEVNRLRLKGVPDEDIVLEIQRIFQISVSGLYQENEDLKAQRHLYLEESERKDKENVKLKAKLFESDVKSALEAFKKKINYNRIQLVVQVILLCVFYYVIMMYGTNTNEYIKIAVSFIVSVGTSLILSIFGFKQKLFIFASDIEDIKSEIKNNISELKHG